MKLSCWSMRPCGVHTRGWVASHEVETRKGDTHIRTTRWPEPSCRLPTRSEFRTLKQRVCVPRSSVQDFKRKNTVYWAYLVALQQMLMANKYNTASLFCSSFPCKLSLVHAIVAYNSMTTCVLLSVYYSIDGPHICNTQLDTSAPAMYSGGSSPAGAGVVSPPHSKVHLHILPKGPRFQAEEQYPPLPTSSWMHESARFLLLMHGPW